MKLGLVALGLAFLALGPALGAAIFSDSYENLQKKACDLQAHGSMAAFGSDEAAIKAMVAGKNSVLDGFYGMASTYGKNDVPGATTVLKNEARLNWDAKKITRALAQEALYCSEASIKFFLDKDKVGVDPNRPALQAGYEASVLRLVGQGESAFAAGQYAKMRRYFYHALWIAYPVTSKAPFVEPKDR